MSIDKLNHFLLNASQEELLAFFSFDDDTPDKILIKFDRWARMYFPEYFKYQTAPFHAEMVLGYINSYIANKPFVNLGFRGSAKTSLLKLFITFVMLNDLKSRKKFIKVLTKDLRNSKKTVTDIFNNIVRVKDLYGEVFIVDKELKQEETMSTFKLNSEVQINAGTVGQQHRGHLQGAFRPDWLIFDDIEDKETTRSIIITTGIIDRCDEALAGMSIDGSYVVLGNYISKSGVIQWFLNQGIDRMIVPVITEDNIPTWPEAFTLEVIEEKKKATNDFYGEYLQDPERSENSYFDLPKLNEAMTTARPPFKTFQGLRYWASPEEGHLYGIGADVGEGSGKDSSTIVVFDFTTNELVASYHNNRIEPIQFAKELERVGYEFNTCIMAPERNNNGVAVLENLRDYPHIYREVTSGMRTIKRTDRMGWHTNKKTRPMMFDAFRKAFNDGTVRIYDIDVLKEMRSYSYSDINESEHAMVTRHYDLLVAATIAWAMKKHAVFYHETIPFEEEEPIYSDIGI
jgi:hypothetical protein